MVEIKIESSEAGQVCPFIRFGSGEETIVIFPPINDAVFEMVDMGKYFGFLFAPLMKRYSIYVIGRKRGMPVGYTTREIARDYAEIFKQGSLGAVHLIGISLGGMIAQHFTYDYPQYVKRLVVIASAHHMGPEGLQIARRWIPWARLGLWKEIAEETINITFHGTKRFFLQLLKPLLVKHFLRKLKDPADFIISGQAGIIHDSTEILSKLQKPVLILGGTEDRFFSEDLFHEMAGKIPGSKLLIIKGSRHGILEQHKKQCLKAISTFLEDKMETSS